MNASARYLNPSEAALRLGVSPKALRLYEQRGLIVPGRTAAGWRSYGPQDMQRAGEIVALRALGLSLAQLVRVFDGDLTELEPALAAHQRALEAQVRDVSRAIAKTATLRRKLAEGQGVMPGEVAGLLRSTGLSVTFDLPWPWGGERFELRDIAPITYIVGPLGSGKTRLAVRLAEMMPGALFVPLGRTAGDAARERLTTDAALKQQVEQIEAWLIDDGAVGSAALTALLVALADDGPAVLVVDMLEDGLDQPTQEALIAYLRRSATTARPLFAMTRSSAILDLAAVTANEAIVLCPANHSPPVVVLPYVGSPGYEALASCLASPEVRERTAGTIAIRPAVA